MMTKILLTQFEFESHACVSTVHLCIVLRKSVSLAVCWNGSPPPILQDLLLDLKQETAALVHRADYKKDGLLQKAQELPQETVTMTLTVASQTDRLALSKLDEKTERVIRESFHFLHTDFSMKLGIECENYIAVYTGKDVFMCLNKRDEIHGQFPKHPMMKDVVALSEMTLKAFNCSNLKEVITGKNVIYVALLYMNDTPAYYVGKASKGIIDRWHNQPGSHCRKINNIIHCFESSLGHFESVIHHQLCHLAIAGAVLKQVTTRSSTAGVTLFAIDFCPTGDIMCCNPNPHKYSRRRCDGGSERPALDHYEQHYMNAFAELFPDSDTEPKMKCLNDIDSCSCHNCSDGSIRGCSSEVALSAFLHYLPLV